MPKTRENYIGQTFGDYLIFAEKEACGQNREFFVEHKPSGYRNVSQSFRLSIIRAGLLPLPPVSTVQNIAIQLSNIYEAIPKDASPEQLALIGVLHTNQTNLEIAKLQGAGKVKSLTEPIEEVEKLDLPEIYFSKGVCRRKGPCSLNRNLRNVRKALATELKSKTVGASMLTWGMVKSLPDDNTIVKDGSWATALNDSTSWRNAKPSEQKAAYEELCSKEEFAEVMAPLHEHFKSAASCELYNSPLVQELARECELDPKAIAASPKGGPTEAAIRLMGVAYREKVTDKTLVISELAKLRPQWLAKVNAIEDRTRMAQAKWREQCTS